MIRTDKWHQFSPTQMAIYEPETPPYGIGALHNMQHEAAHAASELDDEPPPLPRMTRTEVRLVALVWIASATAVVMLGASILARWGVL